MNDLNLTVFIKQRYRMGESDLMRLNKVKNWIQEFDLYAFNFIMDTNTKESRCGILIDEYGNYCKMDGMAEPEAIEKRNQGFKPYVPDLVDFKNKLIIEYQEEPTPAKKGGKLGKKGHTEFSDIDKDQAYKRAGFHQLKIWDTLSDEQQKADLVQFLNPG